MALAGRRRPESVIFVGLPYHTLRASGRASQRLGRLAEEANKTAAHALYVAKTNFQRDRFQRLAGVLHSRACRLDPQTLDCACRRLTRLTQKKSAEVT